MESFFNNSFATLIAYIGIISIYLLVIPLLFEAKFEDICTEIWLVKCPKDLQKNRLITRDKISEKEAYELIYFQLSFEENRKFSDIILENSDDQNKWINKIKELL